MVMFLTSHRQWLIVAFGDLKGHTVYDRRQWAELEWPEILALRSSEKAHGWAQCSNSGEPSVLAVGHSVAEGAPPAFDSLVEHDSRLEGQTWVLDLGQQKKTQHLNRFE